MITSKNLDTLIEVDGGVDIRNIAKLVECGVDILVAGNSIFGAEDPVAAIRLLKNA